MAKSVRFSDIIKSYKDYNTSGEFSVWIEKLELVAELQGVTDKLKFLPLFLSGSAFAVYQQLSNEVKADYNKLKHELRTAFSIDVFSSYEQLKSRMLSEGESVNVYLADLRRLVNLMGQTNPDPLLRCVFVGGLPSDIALQLKSTVDVDSMELPALVSKARAMLASRGATTSFVCAGLKQGRAMLCYSCSEMGTWLVSALQEELTNLQVIVTNLFVSAMFVTRPLIWPTGVLNAREMRKGEHLRRILTPHDSNRYGAPNNESPNQWLCDCLAIIGMDAVKRLGGMSVSVEDVPSFGFCKGGEPTVAVGIRNKLIGLQVEDTDFIATFDGKKWTYSISDECREGYEQEVEAWIDSGWLEEHDETVHGKVQGIIPLMAALQPNKERKIRPVMDYSRELNQHINCNPGADVAVCQDKLRKWRKFGPNCCMLDLKKAYLQLYVNNELLKFPAVRYKDKLFVMTRMGFGLNVAPKIMSKVLGKVLSLDSKIEAGTDHYIDDIIVDNDKVLVAHVREHLTKYGLVTKEPECIDDARVLGLRVKRDESGRLQ
ncbi:uncharacterized protein [Watersipora subatra]|uniref:uncharacterized protein n=1 Tax=Watersipora subatra TaxID=2589382 RepID=UPI00355B5647